jgi:hypothetical protein
MPQSELLMSRVKTAGLQAFLFQHSNTLLINYLPAFYLLFAKRRN